MKTTIPSILYPNARAYRLHSSWSDGWDVRGNAPCLMALTMFDTCGDGLTQHSGAWCPQFPEATDVMLSLTAAILADPLSEAWAVLTTRQLDFSDATLDWALSVVYREDKPQWYSVSEHKVTRADKRNDRRYEPVKEFHNGTPSSAFSILFHDGNPDWLDRLTLADRLRYRYAHRFGGHYQEWEDVFKPATELAGDWHQALAAYSCAIAIVENLCRAKNSFSCAVHNSTPATQAA